MNDSWRAMRPVAAILVCASLMLTLSLGLRQSLGLFMQPMTRDIAISVSEFTFAIAIQNLAWGLAQPFTGALVVRAGFRTVMVAGGVLYANSAPQVADCGARLCYLFNLFLSGLFL